MSRLRGQVASGVCILAGHTSGLVRHRVEGLDERRLELRARTATGAY
jgi:hypothetical protein